MCLNLPFLTANILEKPVKQRIKIKTAPSLKDNAVNITLRDAIGLRLESLNRWEKDRPILHEAIKAGYNEYQKNPVEIETGDSYGNFLLGFGFSRKSACEFLGFDQNETTLDQMYRRDKLQIYIVISGAKIIRDSQA